LASAVASPEPECDESTFDAVVARLTPMDSVRESDDVNDEHVQRLLEAEGTWPPILVWEARNVVVDGAHRLAAARRLGMLTIQATRFDGTTADAYAEAVRRNITHGLPLTLKERTAAAGRILRSSPEWSDRRISLTCGLSPRTIARLRRDASSRGQIARSKERVGRDGRTRPVEATEMRARIAGEIAASPDSSLRAIAARVGASPETVRSVRRGLGRPPLPSAASAQTAVPQVIALHAPRRSYDAVGHDRFDQDRFDQDRVDQDRVDQNTIDLGRVDWRMDRALSSCTSSDVFLGWFESTDVADEWAIHARAVPLSRVYQVADEARRRARVWQQFAEALEGRVHLRHA
jgi:hypothetical protein